MPEREGPWAPTASTPTRPPEPAAPIAPAVPADDEGDIERMAAAMAISDGYEPDNEFVETYVARARAALAALREGQQK